MNDPMAAWVHHCEVNDIINTTEWHQIEINNEKSAGLSEFDHAHYTADDEYLFHAL